MTEIRNTDDFWNGVLHDRIDHIGRVPSRQYSNAISIEAPDKGKQILEDAMQDAPEALSEHVEREEHAIAQSIVTIHHHRNLLVPVMGLPPEILSRILVFHAQIDSRGWLNAALTSTHVCRRWWQVGHTCPELWSHMDSRYSTELMAWMMERSGAVPLSLTIDDRAKVDVPALTLVSSSFHRFKWLDLNVPPRGIDTFFEIFSHPIPLLQQLTIKKCDNLDFAFPPEFLGGSAPNLRHMKLTTGCYIPWDSGLFVHLATLDVSGSEGFGGVTPPPLGMLLSALARMPELETLILRRCFPPPVPSTTAGAYIDLPKLRRLEVAAPLARCTCFLGEITINPSATVLLNIQCSHTSRENVEELFTVFSSCLYAASTPIAQALKFAWTLCGLEVDVWTVQQNAKLKNSQNSHIKLDFSRTWTSSLGVSPLDLTWTCFAALASPQLRSFRMLGGHIAGWDAEVWRRLAHAAPNLRRIAAGTEAQCTEFFKALSPPDVRDPVLADCPLPALSYLELEPPYGHQMPVRDGGEPPSSVGFARSLATRASIGCPTLELVFISAPWKGGCSKGWFDPFDAVPGLTAHMKEWQEEPEMVRKAIDVFCISLIPHCMESESAPRATRRLPGDGVINLFISTLRNGRSLVLRGSPCRWDGRR
ncbi:hypothetical protein BD779DRAFT_1038887 [Infundibulicybe gibba]|nr:hypothetical protein BD779DRAFT_1038887 [Infundibulicybe gibba]